MSSIFENPFKAIIAGLITILLVCFHFSWWRRSKLRAANPPQPPEAAGGWPFLGHVFLLGGSESSELPHITLGALADKYGPIFSIRMGVHPAVVVSSWELAKECFTTHDSLVSSRPKYRAAKILGQNYANFGFAPYGNFWREMRKVTAVGLLSSRRLELQKYIKDSELEISLKDLYQTWFKRKDSSDCVLVEMKQWFADLNLNVILRMVAGKRCCGENAESLKETRRYQKVFRDLFRMTGIFLLGDAIPFLRWLDHLGGHVRAMEKTAKELDDIIGGWLEEHRQRSSENTKHSEDFMDAMLSTLEGVDLDGFDADTVNKATCTTIIAGATDTTAVTLTWALSLLLNNRDVIQKAREELDTHVGKGRLVKESDISNLVYLQAIVKETLRLYPAGPLGGSREFTADATVGGYHIPAGTRLMVNLWKIQTDPRVWSEPLEFKPERFLQTHRDVDVKGQNFELIPFGAGRRQCPGVFFGVQMTQLALAGLLQAFDITTPSDGAVDMRASFGLTNAKTTPLQVLVKPRLPPFLYM